MRLLKPNRFLRSAALFSLIVAPLAAAVAPAELAARLARNENVLVVDVRTATAFAEGHIPGAINISTDLLPYKPLPAGARVVICGDGLGLVDEAAALRAVQGKSAVEADVLTGGYAAWLSETRLSTSASGASRERLPVITYNQVVVAAKSDMVFVDLRTAASTAALKSTTADSAATTAAAQPDLLVAFAGKIGVPVVGGTATSNRAAATGRSVAAAAAPVSSLLEGLDNSGKLLVLVADNEADANDAARQLRARGNYRFTILVGGTEAIRYEGKTGSGRMTGSANDPATQP